MIQKRPNKANNFPRTGVHGHTHVLTYADLSSYSNSRGTRKQFLKGIATFPIGYLPLPLTDAGSMVLGKSRRTFTCEAANGVHTQELAVVLLGGTLVKIYKKMLR